MPDESVTASWKRLTDKVKPPCGQSEYGSFADTFRTTPRQTAHADSLRLESDAASSSAETAATGCHADRNGEAIRQAARLATWEDEGGTTAFVE